MCPYGNCILYNVVIVAVQEWQSLHLDGLFFLLQLSSRDPL